MVHIHFPKLNIHFEPQYTIGQYISCFFRFQGPSGPSSKRGRCKFCRSRAKYVSGQRSFDASRLFGRRRERGEPRRAASEDQRKRDRGSTAEDNEKTIDERSKCSYHLNPLKNVILDLTFRLE